VIFASILAAYIIYSGVWLRENPNKYREAISEFVDIPSDAKYNVIRHGPYDVKPYTDFSFMFWWNKGEWYYKVVGDTKPNSNDVKEVDIKVFKLKSNAKNIFNGYGVLAFEGDFSTHELEVFRDSRAFIHTKYWLNKGPGPIHFGNSFLPDLNIKTEEDAINIVNQLFRIDTPYIGEILTPNEYEKSLGRDYKFFIINGRNFDVEVYTTPENYIMKRG